MLFSPDKMSSFDNWSLILNRVKRGASPVALRNLYISPLCEKDGYEVRQCSVCGKIETNSISRTGHKFTAWRKDGNDYVRDCSLYATTVSMKKPLTE